ncbi:hypothetical protein CRG98_050278, partial [Punica granatum]
MQGLLNATMDELNLQDKALEALVTAMHEELDELVRVKGTRTVGASIFIPVSRLDIPKPSVFKGSRVANDVDNFLWSIETYFKVARVEDDKVRVGIVSMYLFYVEYAEDDAQDKLRCLEHKGDLREYVKTFSDLMLQIPSMDDKEAFFQFMDGLKPWAKRELQRRDEKPDSKGKGNASGGADKPHKSDKGKAQQSAPKDKVESNKSLKRDKEKGPLKCFLCCAHPNFVSSGHTCARLNVTRLGSVHLPGDARRTH